MYLVRLLFYIIFLGEFSRVLGPQLENEDTCKATRLVLKYHREKGLSVRATDDSICLKYSTKHPEAISCTDLLSSAMIKMAGLSEADVLTQKEQMQQISQPASNNTKGKKKKSNKS